jgi:hypothetical protein
MSSERQMAPLDEGSFDGCGGSHRHLPDYASRVKN